MGSAASKQASMNDPSGQRPGDEAMSCDAIKAEIMAQGGVTLNREHVAQARSAARNYQGKQAQVVAEVARAEAAESAMNLAASASNLVPGAGRAADAAAEAASTAINDRLKAHAAATLTPASQEMFSSTATVTGDIASNLQQNPRQARLFSLAMQKNCH
jgi:hypothetical protein